MTEEDEELHLRAVEIAKLIPKLQTVLIDSKVCIEDQCSALLSIVSKHIAERPDLAFQILDMMGIHAFLINRAKEEYESELARDKSTLN